MKNWKKKLKYFLILWIIATIVFAFVANYGLKGMYGGHVKKADQGQFNSKVNPVIIINVNVLSPNGESFISNQSVFLDKGMIIAIDSVSKNREKIQIIDGEGKFLIPGLIDSHVHLFQSQNDLLLYVANGVTQIREMIGTEELLSWKQEINNGRIGPEMFVTSPRLGSFDRMEGWFMSYAQGYDNISNAKEAKTAVKAYHKKGYDGIKIYSQLNKESYQAICKTAEELGMQVMGHIPVTIELSDIYNSSQSEVAHFEEIMNALNREFGHYDGGNANEYLEFVENRCKEVADNLIKNNISVTSTIYGTENLVKQKFETEKLLKDVELQYVNPGLAEWATYAPGGPGWLPEVNMYKVPINLTPEEKEGRKGHWVTYTKAEILVAKNLIKYGVKIMAGTDANIPMKVPGFSLHDEFERLNAAGMSPKQVLQSATSIPANWMKSNTGRILSGHKANLVLLDKNPLEDIRNTKTINTVFLNGQVLDKDVLNQMLKAVKEANDASRKIDISQYIKKEK